MSRHYRDTHTEAQARLYAAPIGTPAPRLEPGVDYLPPVDWVRLYEMYGGDPRAWRERQEHERRVVSAAAAEALALRGFDVERMGVEIFSGSVRDERTGTTPGGMPWRGSPPYRVRGRMRA